VAHDFDFAQSGFRASNTTARRIGLSPCELTRRPIQAIAE